MQARKRIGLRDITAMPPGSEIWDGVVRGFGARRRLGASVTYVLIYRTTEGRARRYTIGQHGSPWTPDTARTEALRLLAAVRQGADPAAAKRDVREAETMADLCRLYLEAAESGRLLTRRRAVKAETTLATDRSRIERHIIPLLGAKKVRTLTRKDVTDFIGDVSAGKTAKRAPSGRKRGLTNVRGGTGAASRTTGLLGAIPTYAIEQRIRTDNPVRGVLRPADKRRERRLTAEEYRGLAKGMDAALAGGMWPLAVSAARFLALTGWRKGEALGLRWQDIDTVRRVAVLPATKSGKSVRPLGREVCALLDALPRLGDLVFPAGRGTRKKAQAVVGAATAGTWQGGIMQGFASQFARIAKLGGVPDDVTPHVLRHAFASEAADLGYADATVAVLLGHRLNTTTSRYQHVSVDRAALLAADELVSHIRVLMDGPGQAETIAFPTRIAAAA